nr:hypothetical protein [Umezawaea tangerina]
MLGASGSGKTTYLHGMFTQLARGSGDFGLFERDPDLELDLIEGWRALAEHGVVPEATDENPRFYEFVLQHREHTAATMSWADFRGGALFTRSDQHSDVLRLRSRLMESDSIHLVLDGGTLAEARLPHDVPRLATTLGAERMSTLVRGVVDARAAQGLALPSIVVLITKADRIVNAAHANGVPHDKRLAEVIVAVIDMLPVLSRTRLTAMVCPVQVGWFGEAEHNIDPARVDTQRLHQPILFSARHQHFTEEFRQRAVITRLTGEVAARQAELDALLVHPFRLPGRRSKVESSLREARTRLAAAEHARATAAYWSSVLASKIDTDVPIIHEGRHVQRGSA